MIRRLLIESPIITASHWDVVILAETDFGCVLMIDSDDVHFSYGSEEEAEDAIHRMQDKTNDILFSARIGVDENGCMTFHDIASRIELSAAKDRLAVFDGTVITKMLEATKMDEAIERNPDFGTW